MYKLLVAIVLLMTPSAAEAQVFNRLIGHKICWSSGRTALFQPNGEFVEDGKQMGSWAPLAGDTIDWSSNRTGRGAVEFTQVGGTIIVKWAGRTLSGKLCN